MVVSEMGDQWSPKTLPDNVADRATISRLGLRAVATGITMGIRIPKVPQAVPMEKLRKAATTKMITGSRKPGMEEAAIRSRMYSAVSS